MTFTFLTSAINALISLPFLFVNFYISKNLLIWFLIFLSGLTFSLSRFFIYKAYQNTDASIVGIIHKLNIVLGAIMGILIFSEEYSLIAYVGLALIALSSIFVMYQGGKISFNKGIVYSLIMTVLTAIAAILDKAILKDFSAYSYVFVNCVATGIFFAFKKNIFNNSYAFFKEKAWLLISRSVLNVVAWTAFIVVLQNTSVSKTFPIYKSLSLIVPVLLGIILLKEKSRLWQKIAGMILGVVGIILVAYF